MVGTGCEKKSEAADKGEEPPEGGVCGCAMGVEEVWEHRRQATGKEIGRKGCPEEAREMDTYREN
jgi:hypothetical protein